MDDFERARNGDKESIERLFEQYHKLAYSVAYEWVHRGQIQKDDAISEAHMALMQCITGNFDKTKGKFSSYLCRAVDNQIRMYLRKQIAYNLNTFSANVQEGEDGEYLDLILELPDTSVDIETEVINKDMAQYALRVLKTSKKFKPIEVACFLERMNGLTCKQIGEKLGISQSYASRLSTNALLKLREILRKEEEE